MNRFKTIKEEKKPVMSHLGATMHLFFKNFRGIFFPVIGIYFLIYVLVAASALPLSFLIMDHPERIGDLHPEIMGRIFYMYFLPLILFFLLLLFFGDSLVRLFVNYKTNDSLDGIRRKNSELLTLSFRKLGGYAGTRFLGALLVKLPFQLFIAMCVMIFVNYGSESDWLANLRNISRANSDGSILFIYLVIYLIYMVVGLGFLALKAVTIFIGLIPQFEGVRYLSAIVSSFKMIRGNFWRIFFTYLIVGLIAGVFSNFIILGFEFVGAIIAMILLFSSITKIYIFIGIISMIVILASLLSSLFTVGLGQTFKTILYFNLAVPEGAAPGMKEEGPVHFESGSNVGEISSSDRAPSTEEDAGFDSKENENPFSS